MSRDQRPFTFVEQKLRGKSFGVLSTISPRGRLQTTGILYGLSPPGAALRLYLITDGSYLKARNIAQNPEVSFLVPYPHHLLSFVPASCISFRGTAEILPVDDPEGRAAFDTTRILRTNLSQADATQGTVFIRIQPGTRMHCYGIGISLMTLARDPTAAGYSVDVPADRL